MLLCVVCLAPPPPEGAGGAFFCRPEAAKKAPLSGGGGLLFVGEGSELGEQASLASLAKLEEMVGEAELLRERVDAFVLFLLVSELDSRDDVLIAGSPPAIDARDPVEGASACFDRYHVGLGECAHDRVLVRDWTNK